MPPLNEVVVDSVEDWPESIVVGLTVIRGAVSAGLTVTVTAFDVMIVEGELLSFTCSSKDQIPAVDRAPVDMVGLSPRLQEKELPRLL